MWWKDGVVYQVYPASFKDTKGTGIGDLAGITQSLDYIKELGCNIVWICPCYDSPQKDMGYDIRDYQKIYPPYGTNEDMKVLLDEAHQRGMKVILDLVINHSSDEHPWFQESKSSKTNPKRDWYIWKPAKYDAEGRRQPPNNWRSNFGGSAWQWDEATEEYYLHLFVPEQPDFNWENEETRKAIYQESMVFWLEMGVDGFRIDTVNMYSKPQDYPDAPVTDPGADTQPAGTVYCNGPRMHEFLGEMNEILSRYDAMSVGECPHTEDVKKALKYVSAKEKQLNMIFQFDVVDVGVGKDVHRFETELHAWKLPELKDPIQRTQSLITGTDAWTTAFLENHDQSRSVSRFGNDSEAWRVRSAKMLAVMLSTLSGTLYVYQGQEIGMINVPIEWPIEEYKDVESINYFKMIQDRYPGDQKRLEKAKAAVQHLARDHARTPMQWNSSKNAGFTSEDATPWMRANDSAETINVEQQQQDKDSVLAFWKQMLALRKDHNELFVHGDFELLDDANEQVFCYRKHHGDQKAVVVLNFSDSEQVVPDAAEISSMIYLAGNVDKHTDSLEPWEGRVYVQ